MTRKNWLLIGLVIALGAISFYINSDWFRADDIQIVHRPVPPSMVRQRKTSTPPVTPVLFTFDRKLALTEVRVVNWQEIQTNKYAHPLWDMISDSNSLPTRGVVYGSRIPGMRPAVKNAAPDPFLPGVKYRLLVEAGHLQAHHDFIPLPKTR